MRRGRIALIRRHCQKRVARRSRCRAFDKAKAAPPDKKNAGWDKNGAGWDKNGAGWDKNGAGWDKNGALLERINKSTLPNLTRDPGKRSNLSIIRGKHPVNYY